MNYVPPAYLFDIDGTLALMGDRGPYEWAKVELDIPNVRMVHTLLTLAASGVSILIISGRDEDCRPETIRWLDRYGIGFDKLFMRPAGDKRPDEVVKREIYDRDIVHFYNLIMVFDDRPKVIRMWRELNLIVADVGNGKEF